MNNPFNKTLQTLVVASIALGLTACSSIPAEPSLADKIRARGEMRVDIAKDLDEGEAKQLKAQKFAKKAEELAEDAKKADKRASSYAEEAQKLSQESAKLKRESEQLSVEGAAQINKAVEAYQNIQQLPIIPVPASAS
jgi:arginyl-tRNA synthetase